MADMIPALPSASAPYAEREVYDWLEDGLPDDYQVFHALPFVHDTGTAGLRPGEIDFVVTHPAKGLLVIEVKGGAAIAYDGRQRQWTSTSHRDGAVYRIRDPYRQAEGHLHRLVDKMVTAGAMRDRSEIPFPFGHACWFPGVHRVDGVLPAHATPAVTLTRQDRTQVQAAVDRAFGTWRGGRKLDRTAAASALTYAAERVLMPEFRIVRSLRMQIEEAEETFARLTDEQARLFNGFLKANRRALVKGFAGTGKTFLAVHRAAELGREGHNTLLLCYNRHLADHLARELDGVPNVKAATFHQLADEWAGHAPGRIFPEDPDQAFWDTGAADLLTEAVEHAGITYDAVLVDEAQDFREVWWYPVELMLREDSFFYVFLDPGQDVYGRGVPDLRRLMDLPTTVPLRKNCRSSIPISRFAARLTPRLDDAVSPEHVGEGPEVRLHAFTERTDQIAQLETIVRQLRQDEKLCPSDIVLLSPRAYGNCLLAEAGYRLAGYDVKPFTLEVPHAGTLYYESIPSFKGLEAPVVVLFDVLDGHVASSDTSVYVACTRARHLLYVLHEEGWAPEYDA